MTPEFEPGHIVILKSNPEVKGAVVSIFPGQPENCYKVVINVHQWHDEDVLCHSNPTRRQEGLQWKGKDLTPEHFKVKQPSLLAGKGLSRGADS